MPAIKFQCPARGCEVSTECWVGNYPQHKTEHDLDAACKKHRAKYQKIRDKHIASCERLGIRA